MFFKLTCYSLVIMVQKVSRILWDMSHCFLNNGPIIFINISYGDVVLFVSLCVCVCVCKMICHVQAHNYKSD